MVKEPSVIEEVGEEKNDLNLPIALRKEVRDCNHLIYSELSGCYKAFVSKVDEIQVPHNIFEALQDPRWKKAVMEEMETLKKI